MKVVYLKFGQTRNDAKEASGEADVISDFESESFNSNQKYS